MAEAYDFSRVSVTALIPAFARGLYTEIPYASQMLDVLRERGVTLSEGPWTGAGARDHAAYFEARFLAVNHILAQHRATQVLELAAGLSPRGLELAQHGVVYVEADLPDSIRRKREIVGAILGSVPENLHLCESSVVDRAQLLSCCAPFASNQPVAVTTEGLLRYLTFDEKTQLAANVREILSRFGGFWTTVDIHLRAWIRKRRSLQRRDEETAYLGRDLDPNYFDDLNHARAFFENCGFQVHARPLLEGIRHHVLTLPDAADDLRAELEARQLFVLTTAG